MDKPSFCRFSLHMKIAIFVAVAFNLVLSLDGPDELDEDSEYHTLDFLDKNTIISYAATSKRALEVVKKHSSPFDAYIKLFDFPMQVANGCITGNKLRGFDPVDCIRLITNPHNGLLFHDFRRQAFTNEQLDILIFNSIEIGNIPVLDALLQIRSSKGDIELTFLQDAFCWALISKTMHRVPRGQGFDFTIPSSIAGLPLNEVCNLLLRFASMKGYAISLSTSVTLDMVTSFHLRLVESNLILNDYFFGSSYGLDTFTDLLSHRPFPTSHFALYKFVNRHRKPASWFKRVLEMGTLIQEGSLCAAVNFWDTETWPLYIKSGMRVNWDDEMKCISKDHSTSDYKLRLVKSAIEELDRQYLPEIAPSSVYHGLKKIDWLSHATYRKWLSACVSSWTF